MNWLESLHLAAQEENFSQYELKVHSLLGSKDEALYANCLELLESDSPRLRQVAIDVIGQLELKSKELRKGVLVEALQREKDATVVAAILNNLRFVFDEPASLAHTVAPYLSSPEPDVVLYALISFPEEMARDYSNELIALCRSEDKDIGFWAADHLASDLAVDGPELREALQRRIEIDPGCEIAYLALVRRRDPSVIPLLRSWLHKGAIRPPVLEAVLEWPQSEYIPALLSQIEWWQELTKKAEQCLKACSALEKERPSSLES